jgi:hypothetical protein
MQVLDELLVVLEGFLGRWGRGEGGEAELGGC